MAFQTGGEIVQDQQTAQPFQSVGATQQPFQAGGEVQQQGQITAPEGSPLDLLGFPGTFGTKHSDLSTTDLMTLVDTDPRQAVHPSRIAQEKTKRRMAIDELGRRGFSSNQVSKFAKLREIAKPGIMKTMKQDIGQTLGGAGGAIGGAKLALLAGQIPPLSALPEEFVTVPLFATTAAFLGGSAGKAAQQAIDPFEDVNVMESLAAGGQEAAFELGGRALGAVGKGIFGRIPNTEAEKGIDLFGRHGGFFTPAQTDKNIITRSSDALSRGSLVGGRVFRGFSELQTGQAVEASQEIIERITRDVLADPDKITKELSGILTEKGGSRTTLFDEMFKPLYDEVDRLAPDFKTTTAPIQSKIEAILLRDKEAAGKILTESGRSDLNKTLLAMRGQGDRSLSQVRDIRSGFVKDAREAALRRDKTSSAYKELASVADDVLFEPGHEKGLPEAANKLLRNTNAVYAAGRELYQDEFVKQIARSLQNAPSKTTSAVFKDMDPVRIRKIRDILISPVRQKSGVGTASKNIKQEFRSVRQSLRNVPGGQKAASLLDKNVAEGKYAWRQLKGAWLEKQINASISKDGILDGPKFAKAIESLPTETRRLMFPGREGQGVDELKSIFSTIGKKKGLSGTIIGAGLEITAGRSAVSSLLTGNGVGFAANGALALSPVAYAKLATNPQGIKFLKAAQKLPAGSGKLATIGARITNLLNEDEADARRDIQKEKRRGEKRRKILKTAETSVRANRPDAMKLFQQGIR